MEITGSFAGLLNVSINKRDFDFGVTLYELTADGRTMHLSYHLARASFAGDETRRELLSPGRMTPVRIGATRLTSRQVAAGSRLLVVFDVNKNSFAQINYGTGKDVSDESVEDAGAPLQVRLFTDSYIDVPIR
jgi:predicted acyl esterase